MSLKIRCVILIGLMLCIFLILNMVRKKRIDLRYALGWLILCIMLLGLDAFPQLIYMLSQFLGIASPVNMLFFLAFIFVTVLIFGLTISVSRLSAKMKKLAQELALAKEKNNDYKKDM